MATNKNQHFVPRCYLKPFTVDGKNLAINLLNIDRQRCIPNAPVKNQCSGDYFYGQDEALEIAIQPVEGAYASANAKIHSPGYALSDEDRQVLRLFILMQHLRTEAASRRSVEMFGGMETMIGAEIPGFKPSIKDAVQMAMRNFSESMHLIDDLKVCLVRNRTVHPFVTSDDPAVMSNRWHFEDSRVRRKSSGIASSGTIFFLPISTRVLCVAYDGDVYSVPHERGWVDARLDRDVAAFNEQQFLNCQANIYFGNWDDHPWALSSYRPVSGRRLQSRYRINYAVFDHEENGQKVYLAVAREEAGEHQDALIHSQVMIPRPTTWPSQLKWRTKGSVYTNGTGAGYLRAAAGAVRSIGGYWRESARNT